MAAKIDMINMAYSKLRISGLTVNPTPEDVSLALSDLEGMMAEYEGNNVCVGYNFTENPDPNDFLGVPLQYQPMVYFNLAIRISPDFNKDVHTMLYNQATQTYSKASSSSAARSVREVQAGNRQPRGSGNSLRYNRWRRFNRPEILPPNECETNYISLNDVNDYREDFSPYLKGEDIASYTISATNGLSILSDSNSLKEVNYRIKAVDLSTSGSFQQVEIIVTSTTGRILTRIINFGVRDASL